MKNAIKIKYSILASVILLLCAFTLSCSMAVAIGQKSSVRVSLVQPRSALPVNFSFSTAGYTYTLTATNSRGTSSTIFSNVAYSSLSNSEELSPDTYSFVLRAFLNGVEAFSGRLDNVTVRGLETRLVFNMAVSAGYLSNATITIELPDDIVASVKAGCASIPLADPDECDFLSAIEIPIDQTNGSRTASYTASTFYTGRVQFVIFYLYDINGAIVAKIPESVIVKPGKSSASLISRSDYNLYDKVEYHLRIAGTPAKQYYEADETEFINDGITVYCDGSNGSSFEVAEGFYETNFDQLMGCNQTVSFSFRGFTGDMETPIHRSNYSFTEEPVKIENANHDYKTFEGTSEIPAVFFKFGDYPQDAKAADIRLSPGTAANGYYIGSDGNYYEKIDSDYCKISPIIWRALNTKAGANNYETIGKAFLVAERCIDGGIKWFENKNERTVNGNKIYSANYEYSTIRAYLNGLNGANYGAPNYSGSGFINKAFTDNARGLIYRTMVKNDVESNKDHSGELGNRVENKHCCNNTQDKIFLLSAWEITDPDYGFNQRARDAEDPVRMRNRTYYAGKKGAYSDGSGAHYWIRSIVAAYYGVVFYEKDQVRYCRQGHIDDGNFGHEDPSKTDKGIVPALWVSTNGYVDTIRVTGSLNKQYYAAGENFDPSGLTVTHFDENRNQSVISASEYTTNFASLSGANQTLYINYQGMEAEVEQLVHKASYQFTESPVLITGDERKAHTSDGDKNPTSSGTFYKFGDYPQQKKADNVDLSSGTAPWCGYYIGTDGNYYASHGTNYFKVEPIVWRALKTENNKALLFSEYCLDSGVPFYWTNSVSSNDPYVRRYSGRETKTYNALDIMGAEQDRWDHSWHNFYAYGQGTMMYPNSYDHSTIRAYLNGIDASAYHRGASNTAIYDYSGIGFLQKAFTPQAQLKIIRSTVKNDITSGVIPLGSEWATTKQITRFCPDTEDKIFLLSLEEVTTADYGFSTNQTGDDGAKRKYRSDYAADCGAYTQGGYAHYLLRTPKKDSDKQNFYYVKENGNPGNTDGVTKSDKGIVPALWVSLDENFEGDSREVTTDPLLGNMSSVPQFASNTTRTLAKSYDLYNLIGEGYNEGVYGPVTITKAYMMTSDKAETFNIATDRNDEGVTELYVVTLSGTEMVSGQSTGIWTDLQSGTEGGSDYLDNISYIITGNAEAYSRSAEKIGTRGTTGPLTVGLPQGSNLLITGHSLGGMIAQQAAAQDNVKNNYEVLNVVTYGSPLLANDTREGELHRL
ncbi:MAG: lipase family protein, partial [Treponemataceae bacterium]|nr:lipase family protein [Treponemataceae bacterium]